MADEELRVAFDFDGVLVDTEWAIYQAWLRTFQTHGHDLPLDIYTHCIGSDFATWSPKTHLEDLTGQAFDWHDLDARRQEEILAELTHEGTMPGVIALLEKLTPLLFCNVSVWNVLDASVLSLLAGVAGVGLAATVAPRAEAQGAAPAVKGGKPLRVALLATPFEAMVWAVTGQQISVAAATSVRRRLIEAQLGRGRAAHAQDVSCARAHVGQQALELG